jgi:hypothetical protein
MATTEKTGNSAIAAQQITKHMKNLSKILLAAALTVAFTSVNRAQADESLVSPHQKQLHYGTPSVAASPNEPNLAANRPIGNAKAWELTHRDRIMPSVSPSVDLAHAPRPNLSPKDPNYEVALRENAVKQLDVQIAPLK